MPADRLPGSKADAPTALTRVVMTGTLSGAAAALVMWAQMKLVHRFLPLPDRHSVPPQKVTMRLAEVLHVKDEMDEDELRAKARPGCCTARATSRWSQAMLSGRSPPCAAIRS